jgi:hypothetical protein
MSRLLDQRLFAPGFPSLPSLIYTSVKRRYGPGVLTWKSSGPQIYEGGLQVKIWRTREASNIAVGEPTEVGCCPNSPAPGQHQPLVDEPGHARRRRGCKRGTSAQHSKVYCFCELHAFLTVTFALH